MDNLNKNRSDIVSVVTSPLGFFALSLLIVEGFLAIVMIFSEVNADAKFWGMIIGAILFFVVVSGVWYLVLKSPKNLTFGEFSHLEHEKMFGTETKLLSKQEVSEEASIESTVVVTN